MCARAPIIKEILDICTHSEKGIRGVMHLFGTRQCSISFAQPKQSSCGTSAARPGPHNRAEDMNLLRLAKLGDTQPCRVAVGDVKEAELPIVRKEGLVLQCSWLRGLRCARDWSFALGAHVTASGFFPRSTFKQMEYGAEPLYEETHRSPSR